MSRDIARRALALVVALMIVTSIPFAVIELGGPDVSPVGTASAKTLATYDFEGSSPLDRWTIDAQKSNTIEIVSSPTFSGSGALYIKHNDRGGSHPDVDMHTSSSHDLNASAGFNLTGAFRHDFGSMDNNVFRIRIIGDGGSGNNIALESNDVGRADAQEYHLAGNIVDGANPTGVSMVDGTWRDFKLEYDEADDVARVYFGGTQKATGTLTGSLKGPLQIQIYLTAGGNSAFANHYYDDLEINGTGVKKNVSGFVENQHGDPVQNATVQVWGVDYSQITPDAGETEKDQALDLIEESLNKTPTEWTEQLESGFTLAGPGGHFEQDGVTYAAVHHVEDWKRSSVSPFAKENPTLDRPLLTVDASKGETASLALSVWDSDKFGVRNAISPVKNDLPGEPIEGRIVVETLVAADGKVGEIQTSKTEVNCNFVGCDWSAAFVEIRLSPGFYRVYPKGHSSSAYVIKVGDPVEIWIENLRDQQNELTDQASDINDRLSSGKFVKATTTTAADGSWSVKTGADVKTVAVQAYKAPGVSVNDTDLSYQTIIDEYSDSYRDGEQLERLGSIYLPSEVQRVDPPASDVNITVQEMTFPPYGDQTTLEDFIKDLIEEMLNETLAQTSSAFSQVADDVARSSLEDTYETLRELYRDNAVLREVVDQLDEDSSRDLAISDDPSSLSDTELQDSVFLINQGIETVGSQLDGSVDEDIGTDTISQTWTFAGDIREDTLTLLIHWSNGSTTTLTTESQYLRINKRAGLGDQVLLEDYPINSTDPSSLTFELLGVGEANGEIVREKNTIRNPRFDGNIPTLDAIELTSLEPGPSDQVDIEIHPKDAARFGSLVSATVTGPDGNDVLTDSISSNGRESGFKTSGTGVYHVSLTFNNSDGDEFTETIRVFADDFNDQRPPSAQIRTGPTGRYLVVGDGLESGSVDVSNDGQISVAARIPQDADVPGTVQLYIQDVDTGSRTEVTVSVVRGETESRISQRIGVILHMNEITETAVLYREDNEPLPRNGSNAAGEVDARENGSTIQSFTEADGKVTILVENDPSFVERALYRIRGIDLPGLSVAPIVDLSGLFGTSLVDIEHFLDPHGAGQLLDGVIP